MANIRPLFESVSTAAQIRHSNDSIPRIGGALVCLVVAYAATFTSSSTRAEESVSPPRNEKREARQIAEREWARIVGATMRDRAEFEMDPTTAWLAVFNDASPAFNRLIREAGPSRKPSHNQRDRLAFFAEQFGKHDPVVDMAWCLVQMPEGLMPAGKRDLFEKGNARDVQLIVAELKVRRFLANPKLLARYCEVFAWERTSFDPLYLTAQIDTTRDKLRNARPEEYWWDALSFLFLAHITDRGDLLRDVEADMLRGRFEAWYEWFEQNKQYLSSTKFGWRWTLDEDAKQKEVSPENGFPTQKLVPDVPFSDWNGPPLPRREFFNLIR